MPKFTYKAMDFAGRLVEGAAEATDQSGLISKLKGEGLSLLSFAESGETKKHSGGRKRRINRLDILNFTHQLASLLRAKLPLAKALAALEQQAAFPEMQVLMGSISAQVGEGRALSDVLADHPEYFPSLYRSMVRAGEVGGILDGALTELAAMLERDEAMRSRLKGALTYPLVMLAVMIISVTILMTFVVPRFTGVFADMGGELPLPTKVLVGISGIFQHWWWLMGLAVAAAVSGIKKYAKTPEGRLSIDRIMLTLPVFGQLVREMSIARFATTFGSLLGSGVPMLQALEATSDVAGNAVVGNFLEGVRKEVGEGRSLSDALKQHGDFFPTLVLGMVATGEETGNLPEMLGNVGQYFTREADQKIKAMTTMLEPVIILVMGVLVGFIIIAMLLPIFQMTTLVK